MTLNRRWPKLLATKSGRYQLSLIVALAVLCGLTVAPFLWVIVTAIKPNTEIYAVSQHFLPDQPTLEHFRKVISKGDQLPSYVFNTLVYSAATIGVVVLFGSMAGYALGMLRPRGSQAMISAVLLLLSVPWVILLVPLLMFEFRLGIWNTRLGLILPYIGLFLPFAIWIMRGSFTGLPRELGEAARIDGASEFFVFWRVYLPMAKGGLATVVLLTFIQVWNEVLLAATLAKNPIIANINVGLRILADEGQSFAFGILSAVILLAMIPTLIVFIVLQRYYVKGISEGALAGF
ncbi:MAG: carbohydrate ABC transporter permease [Chloroflexi bacterium]|nr:carbohydrate ABC transporter permease [Chloroflexota bacterium]MCI0574937.1 carbohydrate ABC transporter permease [Chloroflexota bacterium]MCI0645847.1 carbohydrate ABC transporter permease [Chloroflexota bacterium]MCI0725702.1 carbohydrate ABC transporter permease [Chloroflexota bacterium]